MKKKTIKVTDKIDDILKIVNDKMK